MSFEMFDGRPEESVELSPKLAALAEQLSDDARMLGHRYPAPGVCSIAKFEAAIAEALRGEVSGGGLAEALDPQAVRASNRDTMAGSRTCVQWTIRVSICAVMVLAAMAIWQSAVQWGVHSDRVQSAAIKVAGPREARQIEQKKDYTGAIEGAVLRRVENVLRGLSAAEQEAVIDLLEDGSQRSESFSI